MSRFTAGRGIKRLTDYSYKAIDEGAYEASRYNMSHKPIEMRDAIYSCPHTPLITEIKFASPSLGQIRKSATMSPEDIAITMVNSGAVALSVLTQPYLFNGSVATLAKIRKLVKVPILMKDIIVSEVQIEAAKSCGADCVLLIRAVFDQDLAEASLEKFIAYTKKKELQVLVEVHSGNEFADIAKYKADLVGINNRNLEDLRIDISTTERLLNEYGKGNNLIVSESGIKTPEDIRFLKNAGVDAFLVGTGIMEVKDLGSKVRELYLSV